MKVIIEDSAWIMGRLGALLELNLTLGQVDKGSCSKILLRMPNSGNPSKLAHVSHGRQEMYKKQFIEKQG